MVTFELSIYIILSIHVFQSHCQSGPDPWNYESTPPEVNDESHIPPDIRMPLKRKLQTENKLGMGEWFFRRMLAIILKGGQTKIDEDGSVDVSLQMKLDPKQWETLDECLKSNTPLTEDMLRRTIGYVQDSIYKPSITEKIVMAWSDYIQVYLSEYKTHITWILCFLAAAGGTLWLWSHMSHKHLIIILFIIFYAYEVVVSYKEAEQKELEKFLSAVDRCNWFFWKSTCEVPPPDPIVFMKHMNPMKIGIRMFTTALAEPIVTISGIIDVILGGVTDGLWYPCDKIAYGILTIVIKLSLIYFLVMIIFNFILNIPFNLGFGFFGVSIGQRQRTSFLDNRTTQEHPRFQDSDRISQATLNGILNICSLALSNNNNNNLPSNSTNINPMLTSISRPKVQSIHRSASTGRLPNLNSSFECTPLLLDNVIKRNKRQDGSGDTL